MQPKELEQWIGTQYGVSAEYPWAVSPENAVFRHRENKKWFALLLRVTGDKFRMPGYSTGVDPECKMRPIDDRLLVQYGRYLSCVPYE